jgi:hypothetical protein
MKVVLRSSSLPLTILGILTNVGVVRVDTVLRRGLVGRLRIGMSAEEAKAELGIDPGGSSDPDVTMDFLNGSLVRCQVLSRRYRTVEGIGVGSSSAEVELLYPLTWEEPGVAFVESLHMRLVIQQGKIVKILVS